MRDMSRRRTRHFLILSCCEFQAARSAACRHRQGCGRSSPKHAPSIIEQPLANSRRRTVGLMLVARDAVAADEQGTVTRPHVRRLTSSAERVRAVWDCGGAGGGQGATPGQTVCSALLWLERISGFGLVIREFSLMFSASACASSNVHSGSPLTPHVGHLNR